MCRSLNISKFNKIKIISITIIILASSCATRSYTTPHSQLIEEAADRGEKVQTLEEQRKKYEQIVSNNKSELNKLIKERGGKSKESEDDYVIGPLDQVEINVFGVPELNTQVRVSQSGFISLPLLGGVQIAGLSESGAEALLKRKLGSYVRSPEVSVSISEFGSKAVSVLGAVQSPGAVNLKKGKNNLLEVVGLAGGINEKAGSYLLFVPGTWQGKKATSANGLTGIEIPLDEVMGSNGQKPLDIPILGGDSVIVPVAGQVVVEGEVEQRGAFELGGRMTLLGALAAAGGVTYSALVDQVEIVRRLPDSEKVVLVFDLEKLAAGQEQNMILKEGDIVRVPSAVGRRFATDIISSIQKMINFGVGSSYQMNPGT
jgi:polysaccharide biosynthesis/export protein